MEDAASKPALSVIVPSSVSVQGPMEALIAPKQKRLFPVACRVVPTDQWFTSRVDRTWKVIDLKLWLLSRALPTHVLPLPASFRPSSPVTFASAISPPTSSRPPFTAQPLPTSSTIPSPNSFDSASIDPTAFAPVYEYDVQYFGYTPDDRVGLDQDDGEDEDEDDEIDRPPSHSVPYSFSTGAPAISGLDALRAKAALSRGYGSGPTAVDSEFVSSAEAIARRWRIYSFSTGILLVDELPLSEYGIFPFELLELHRVGAYVRLPRTIRQPLSLLSADDDEPPSEADTTQQTIARAYYSTVTIKPTSPEPVSSDNDEDSEPLPMSTPYARPYFDCWVWILNSGSSADGGRNDDGSNQTDPSGVRKMRRRTRAKSEATSVAKGKERLQKERDRELSELQKLLGGGVSTTDDGINADAWRKRWLMIREGLLTIWKEKSDVGPELSFDMSSCNALHDAEKIPSILATSSSTTQDSEPSSSTSLPLPIICARFRATTTSPFMSPRDRGRHKDAKESRKPPANKQRRPPWLIIKLPDESTHEHLLRVFHRLAYPGASVPSSNPTPPRVLRTDFLPNHIPHPLSLSFSDPSPIERDGDHSPTISESHHQQNNNSIPKHRQWAGMGLGPSMGVRFPDWREHVLRRAIRAGQGFPAGEEREESATIVSGSANEDPYGFGTDTALDDLRPHVGEQKYIYDSSSDADSDMFSEVEWEGWAYDLDRPQSQNNFTKAGKGKERESERGQKNLSKRPRSGLKTPHGSPVSDEEFEVEPGFNPDAATRKRAKSITLEVSSSTPSSVPSSSQSVRLRSSTVSTMTSPTSMEERMNVHKVAVGEPRVRGLMRGLSIRGRESILRGLENALDFVDGK